MVKTENNCLMCGLPCLGSGCPYRNVKHCYCDKCGDDVETLYEYNGKQLCKYCVLDELPQVDPNEY